MLCGLRVLVLSLLSKVRRCLLRLEVLGQANLSHRVRIVPHSCKLVHLVLVHWHIHRLTHIAVHLLGHHGLSLLGLDHSLLL